MLHGRTDGEEPNDILRMCNAGRLVTMRQGLSDVTLCQYGH